LEHGSLYASVSYDIGTADTLSGVLDVAEARFILEESSTRLYHPTGTR
jgi:hypothetical protein